MVCQWRSLLIILEKRLRTEQRDFSKGKLQNDGVLLGYKLKEENRTRLAGKAMERCTRAMSNYLVALPWKWEYRFSELMQYLQSLMEIHSVSGGDVEECL